jgi:predicted dehydrogenase
MNAVVIGLGSMGKRRIRLIKKLDPTINVVGVDISAERRATCETEWNIMTCDSLESVLDKNKPDYAFICTSPLSHSMIIKECLQAGMHVFCELNLVSDGYKENMNLARDKNLVLFLSSTFMYRDEIKYIKGLVGNA